MTSPEFVAEMTAQLEAARQEMETAADPETVALAAARVANLTDLTCRHGTDISHILAPAMAGGTAR